MLVLCAGALAQARARAQGSCKGAGPGHSRVPVRARKGALTLGALARVPVRARTHRTSPVPVD